MSLATDYYTQPDPPVLDTQADVVCPDDCPETTRCNVCDALMCSEHTNEYTTCVDSMLVLHHHECVHACAPCAAAGGDDW